METDDSDDNCAREVVYEARLPGGMAVPSNPIRVGGSCPGMGRHPSRLTGFGSPVTTTTRPQLVHPTDLKLLFLDQWSTRPPTRRH